MNGALNLHPKAVGTGVGGALSLVIIWLLTLAHVSTTPEVAGALVTLVTFVGAWLAPILQKELSSGQ